MFELLREMLNYPLWPEPWLPGAYRPCASLLGVSLVLKRYSMIGDGLSHVSFGAPAVATALNACRCRCPYPWWLRYF